MDQGYNLYNLEASFKKYLLAGNVRNVSVKNYLSDFRHFAGWLILYLKSHQLGEHIDSPLPLITAAVINEYKSYLIENNIPHKTINRRLSTVRKFYSFCIGQGWLKENPAKHVSNITQIKTDSTQMPQILDEFQKDLQKASLDEPTIKSYLDDVREFLSV